MKRLLPISMLALAALAGAGVVSTDKGSFLISKKRPQAGVTASTALADQAQAQARDFCAKEHKVLGSTKVQQIVNYEKDEGGRERPVVVEASLEFKCLAKP